MDTTIGILGNNFQITTKFVEKIILNTKASSDQEHIKMNIIINNYLEKKSKEEINNLLIKIQNSKIDYLILTINDDNLYQMIIENGMDIINNTFDINDNLLVEKVIKLCGKEINKWKLVL